MHDQKQNSITYIIEDIDKFTLSYQKL